MITSELALINFIIIFIFFLILTKSYSFIILLFLVEICWISIFELYVLMSSFLFEFSFHFYSVIILIISAVELVVGLLVFIIYYHIFNTTNTGNSIVSQAYYIKKQKINKKKFNFFL